MRRDAAAGGCCRRVAFILGSCSPVPHFFAMLSLAFSMILYGLLSRCRCWAAAMV
jgi:hypothetical protein